MTHFLSVATFLLSPMMLPAVTPPDQQALEQCITTMHQELALKPTKVLRKTSRPYHTYVFKIDADDVSVEGQPEARRILCKASKQRGVIDMKVFAGHWEQLNPSETDLLVSYTPE